ncbi:(2Fe-2S)-binding protein [Paraburkholderia sp. J41]|uniref:(2Fe-2S)-binding protein n=1 Tax=Paraburkholderia sp. J41 TaxID=2805433 RepID=UPI002AC326E3|nr:(2Fe-2S)-binding protein [Paraburkholderia sp. J41]
MSVGMTITVNGRQHEVQADAETPLVYVLRNEIGLHGTKFGCGVAQCGVCSVLLDGQEIRSCIMPVGMTVGHEITTLEGLGDVWAQRKKASAATPAKGAADGNLHPVQQAWIDHQVPQCGYCQSGMMVQAVSLLNTNPRPTRADIVAAMQGHICRCGTHMRIIAAVEQAAEQMGREG